MRRAPLHAAALAALAAPALAAASARLVVVNADPPGVGFNDATPAAPLPSNPGTTVGEQRLIAFQFAADTWGAAVDSRSEIRILASFSPLPCTATTAVLGSAGAESVFANFRGAVFRDTWYPSALADELAGADQDPGAPDIEAFFNGDVGGPGCLEGFSWYYGRDTNHAPDQLDLVTVLLHEFAHGLGFQSFVDVETGALLAGLGDVFSRFQLDAAGGKMLADMATDAERAESFLHSRGVVWTGPHVHDAVKDVLARGAPRLDLDASQPRFRLTPQLGVAQFGPPLAGGGVQADVALARDADGGSLACGPLANPAEVAGKVALVDRGACAFAVKVRNAQAAGALAVIVEDSVPGGPPPDLAGADPAVAIPSVRVTQADGEALKSALGAGPVRAKLAPQSSVRFGADERERAMLFAPDPAQPGSSISHWDPLTTPNQLMEPALSADLTLSVAPPQDLTRELLRDIGWFTDRDLNGIPDDPREVVRRTGPSP